MAERVEVQVGAEVLDRWEDALSALETDPMAAADQLDWVAKYRLIDGYRERNDLEWGDARLAAMDLQYHDLRPERSLFDRLDVERVVTDDEADRAVTEPPSDTRAYFRGQCLKRYGDEVFGVNWDSISFGIGDEPIKRILMAEPLKGTKAHVDELLERSKNAGELVTNLRA